MWNPGDDPRVRAVLERQGGLIRRRQAIDLGLDPGQVRRLVARGRWRQVRRGIYADQAHEQALQTRSQRQALEIRAASMSLSTPHVLSHDSAALLLGLATLAQPAPLVHVTRRGAPRALTRDGIKRHHARFDERQVETAWGLPVLGVARTAIDIAREHGLVHGVAAIDAARQLGLRPADFREALEPMVRWPNVIVARTALDRSDPGAESIGETLARLMLEELDLGPVETQFELSDGVRRARCDLRVGRHLFEFDGRVKYLRPDSGGVATTDPERVVWEEKLRQDWLLGYQLGMSRLVWADFWGARRREAMARLAREYALTVARFGSSIDDLSHLVVRRPAA